METHERFKALLKQFGNIAELSRQSGMSRRGIEFKRDGLRPVKMWDVWALERALQIKEGKATE